MADIAGALARAAETLRIDVVQADAPHGPVQLGLVPEKLTLDPFLDGSLTEVVTGQISLQVVQKLVGFATAPVADATGNLVADPLADPVPTESPVDAVQGTLTAIQGLVPIGFTHPGGAVDIAVRWNVTRRCDGAAEASFAPDDPLFLGPDTGASVEMLLIPPVAPLEVGQDAPVCRYDISAEVQLTALGVTHDVTLGPVTVPVPAILVPSIALFFSETHYNTAKPGGMLVLVPPGLPTEAAALLNQVNGIVSVLNRFASVARFAAMIAGLGAVLAAIGSFPANTKHKRLFLAAREHHDLRKLDKWRHRSWWPDADPNDDIDSIMLVSVETTRRLHLYGDDNFRFDKTHKGHAVLHPGPGGLVQVPVLDNVRLTSPGSVGAPTVTPAGSDGMPGATMEIRVPARRNGSWHDIITSFRWEPHP